MNQTYLLKDGATIDYNSEDHSFTIFLPVDENGKLNQLTLQLFDGEEYSIEYAKEIVIVNNSLNDNEQISYLQYLSVFP